MSGSEKKAQAELWASVMLIKFGIDLANVLFPVMLIKIGTLFARKIRSQLCNVLLAWILQVSWI